MGKRRALLGLLLLVLCSIGFGAPAVAVPLGVEAVTDWVPVDSVPAEMLDGRGPKGRDVGPEAMALVVAALGQPYRWLSYEEEYPIFFRDANGQYGFVMTVRIGVILTGTDDEVKQKVARGLFDRVYYVRAEVPYQNGQWEKGIVGLLDSPFIEAPALPAGGPAAPAEQVRGWAVTFADGVPTPPIGSGLSLSDAGRLTPLLGQIALYPAEAILPPDSADRDLLVSTQVLFEAAVVSDRDTEAIAIVRTVNAYRRAAWMETLWKNTLSQATDRLDDAARAAGVAPDRTATQRLLVKRTADGWQVAEARQYDSAFALTVEPPTVAERVIGGLGTLDVRVPRLFRYPEPVDAMTSMAVTVGATAVLAAWAGVQAMGMYGRQAQMLREFGGESTGSRLAKAASNALDWLLRPVEKPLAHLTEKVGATRLLVAEEDGGPPDAAWAPGGTCSACGTRVAGSWSHCTGCGAHLTAGTAVAAGSAPSPTAGPTKGGEA